MKNVDSIYQVMLLSGTLKTFTFDIGRAKTRLDRLMKQMVEKEEKFRRINSSTKLISTFIILYYDKSVVNFFLQKLTAY